jgi:hypothetical protein
MGLKVFGVMYWIPLTKDSNKWQGLVNLAMNIQVPYRARNLAIRVTVKVSKDSVPMIANKSHGGTSFHWQTVGFGLCNNGILSDKISRSIAFAVVLLTLRVMRNTL